MELEKALETVASTVTTLPKGIILLNATWLTEAVTTIRLECRRAAILAARSIRANNSPPNMFPIGLVSLGSTKSVTIVLESLAYFACISIIFCKGRMLLCVFNVIHKNYQPYAHSLKYCYRL